MFRADCAIKGLAARGAIGCALCHHAIAGTVEDPVICGTSLGAGYFHEACARVVRGEHGERTAEP